MTLAQWLALSVALVFAAASFRIDPLRPLARACSVGLVALALSLGSMVASRVAPGAGSLDALVSLGLLSSVMLALVAALGYAVLRYARRYLDRAPDLDRFTRNLLRVLACASIVAISNNLVFTVAAWSGASFFLHALLTFDRRRAQAALVAHKKFVVSRAADLCFVAALALFATSHETLRIDAINAASATTTTVDAFTHAAMVFVVLGVLLKSAQLPAHGWLTHVMEAPTPISALLHAGIVNIGGFVLLRLAPTLDRAPVARAVLLVVALASTVVASLVMVSRPTIKAALAWSTIAQVGFMLVQCACGAWSLAALHLVAHSLYKAFAFSSANGVVAKHRSTSAAKPARAQQSALAPIASALALLVAITLVATGARHATLVASGLVLAASIFATRDRWASLQSAKLAIVASFAAVFAGLFAVAHVVSARLVTELAPTAEAPLAAAPALVVLVVFALEQSARERPRSTVAAFVRQLVRRALEVDERVTRWLTRRSPLQKNQRITPAPQRASKELESW
ncbi:MAG: hypothetical protein JNK05_30000 [Myxococcales bacterium]|nr:hypothetical protein [Myxococcales bacterium]